MSNKRSEEFGKAIDRMLKIWGKLSLVVAELHPELSQEERDNLTRKAMNLVMRGLFDQQMH